MTSSIWRYSHLALAVSSFVFIFLASVTGIILSFEPIQYTLEVSSEARAMEDVSLAQTLTVLREKYDEVLDIQTDEHHYVSATLLDKEGNYGQYYIHPKTGKLLGEQIETAPIYEWCTNLHRSLFLKSTGRFFVGLSSFLLLLITVSGVILIIKRQRGLRNFAAKIIRENFFQYFHVYLGRLALVPILIITITGTYLSLLRFELIPDWETETTTPVSTSSSEPSLDPSEFPVFNQLSIADIRKVEFPFSDDAEDRYLIQLKDVEISVNQYTGVVESETPFPFTQIAQNLSTALHTGQGSVAWSIVLALSCICITFFIASGFIMTFRRLKGKTRNKFGKDEAEIVLLIGSESGTTGQFAKCFAETLMQANKRVYIDELNHYSSYASMKHLVVFTATYGTGEAPSNARKFSKLIASTDPNQPFNYAVVGFGSLSYPNFCQFAFEVEDMLSALPMSRKALDTHTIHNKSWESFHQWTVQWADLFPLELAVSQPELAIKAKKKEHTFHVLRCTAIENRTDNTFTLELESPTAKYVSGDLLSILPENHTHERLYSIAQTQAGTLLLSIKRHDYGICSTYLSNLKSGDRLYGSIVRNREFHFNSKSSKTVMIATGTGIAPFLGMIENNSKHREIDLYWGGQTSQSFRLYEGILSEAFQDHRLSELRVAYSRENASKVYVQDLLLRDQVKIAEAFQSGAQFMICGSIAMQKGVVETLHQITLERNNKPLSYYQNKGQLKMDCY
ncbi:PepSY domain-containing protein [Phaeocystidibacter marisrubri]|uniref:NADPH--hemoprotein reductase n=1 Tax=Phaeocystidibacter marisrubri TaxID=1577780 RepID=A0A6L3ZKU1_9FLAO|nr:PepSY domain-containing protein [Phaeocystidibacter marisrubri]KAB2817780.1 FAD-binding oxidoreductase [Phaeocystidibacter marisrubri]GGH73575.1 hypothetical protein GCM10011318_18730 [Phaeocystidibacter marisrubri]